MLAMIYRNPSRKTAGLRILRVSRVNAAQNARGRSLRHISGNHHKTRTRASQPRPTALLLILFIDMKLVQKAMHDGREHDPHHGDENQSAKQRVKGSENFDTVAGKGADRAHP